MLNKSNKLTKLFKSTEEPAGPEPLLSEFSVPEFPHYYSHCTLFTKKLNYHALGTKNEVTDHGELVELSELSEDFNEKSAHEYMK